MIFKRKNLFVFIYIVLAIGLELVAQLFFDAKPYFIQFWLLLIIVSCFTFFLFFIKNVTAKNVIAMVLLFIQIIAIMSGNFLYKANGTAFQNEMLNQRNDAFGTMEKIDISIELLIICLITLVFFIALGVSHIVVFKKRWAAFQTWNPGNKKAQTTWRIVYLATSIVLLLLFCSMPIIDGFVERSKPNYYHKLEVSGDGNQMRGVSTNILCELLKFGSARGVSLKGLDKVDDFIYAEKASTSEFFGTNAKEINSTKVEDNNLIMILAESLDTHVFDRYRNVPGANELLFPNLMYFMDNGLNFTNFRQKEKTDTSEALTLLGHYPTKRYVNYDFENNSYPFSLPNLFRESFPNAQVNYFHHNRIEFYNRNKLMKSFGFQETFGVDQMNEFGMGGKKTTSAKGWDKVDRNLDSKVIEYMKDEMFPTDKQFFTYWTTFTSHGFYRERENLRPYYTILDDNNLFPKGGAGANDWRNYAATIMDFDNALGQMKTDLIDKGILDKTTILIVGDHETYYSGLARYANGQLGNTNGYFDTENFRVSCLIYDQKLQTEYYTKYGTKEIDKFVTSGDLVPTLLDLFGIESWKNLYLGSSVFTDTGESIAYSRVYGYFFNDLMLFYSKNDLLWKSADFKQQDFDSFIINARKHLDKLFIIDKIYFSNYFKKNAYSAPAL